MGIDLASVMVTVRGFLLLAIATVAFAIPPPTPIEVMMMEKGYSLEEINIKLGIPIKPHNRSHDLRTGFKHYYVGPNGAMQKTRGSGTWLDVEATYGVSDLALYRAALIASKQTKYMPSSIFNRLASRAKVGVFTKSESLTVFPEYYSLRGVSTSDGRPYSSLAGTGGVVAAIIDHNVLCDGADPYNHNSNILVHEFAHTIHTYGLSSSEQHQVQSAFNQARAHNTWTSTSYAMRDVHEYFAEASQTFFNVERLGYAAGSLITCGHSHCSNEQDSRYWLYSRDQALYNVLTYVYTNNRPTLYSGLAVCTS